MAVTDIKDAEFDEKTSTGVDLIDFWATWCGPCKMQSPVIEHVAEGRSDVNFYKMDVDENPKTAQEIGVLAIPTLLIKKDGEVVDRITGYTPADELNKILDKYTK
ncbi:Thioredoxin [Weissella viridescens]|uniref:Thioredoxin n=2 Tax=Weissella viridescens TaxID=1629 RepID=A0A0R2H6E7_WEIVI|nr:thioredoxin [Weissella viridescens]KRN45692.1 thioredoxin [Weissella viridescens]MBX4173488.1 thioredoxin [Weissella viridescens]GEA95487.1 thioredoxin [Weissella viridescens]SOB42156.1 Thioredoxin [Weissella viridescens]